MNVEKMQDNNAELSRASERLRMLVTSNTAAAALAS